MQNTKTILITGASSGFGKATAELLAKSGFKLILVARRADKLAELKKELNTDVQTFVLDVRDRNAVERLFQDLPEGFRNIDILLNNAGLARGMAIAADTNLDDWEEMIDTNIKGLTYFTRLALPIMQKRNCGLIINIGSVAGNVPYKGGNVYGASKAFVNQFTRNLRTDLAGTNIKATCIEPGIAETEFSEVRFKGDTEKAKAVYAGTRPLTSEDIANTIKWVIDQPEHVNIDKIEIMPVDQTFAGLLINRK